MAQARDPHVGREVFSAAVRAVFSRWTLLRLAVDQGWSDGDGKALSDELLDAVLALLLREKKVYQDEVEDLLFDTLEDKFNTLAEDGSVEDVSTVLCVHASQCNAPGDHRCSQAYPAIGMRSGTANSVIAKASCALNVDSHCVGKTDMSDSNDDEDDEDGDEVEAMAIEPRSHPQKKEPAVDEDGFQVVVRTSGRRGKNRSRH